MKLACWNNWGEHAELSSLPWEQLEFSEGDSCHHATFVHAMDLEYVHPPVAQTGIVT